MIYIEFIDRDRTVPLEVFRYNGVQTSSWNDAEGDELVLQLGRTLRFGPRPAYLALWRIASSERLDAWEDYFASQAATGNRRSQAMHRSIDIARAGLYDEIFTAPEMPVFRLYAIEFAKRTAAHLALVEAYRARSNQLPQLRLCLVLDRIGHLAPDPGILAIWGADCYAGIEALARTEASFAGCEVLTTGVYRSFGTETL